MDVDGQSIWSDILVTKAVNWIKMIRNDPNDLKCFGIANACVQYVWLCFVILDSFINWYCAKNE